MHGNMNVKFISKYILGQYSNTVPSECMRKLLPVYSPCRAILLIIMDMMMLVMVIIGGDVVVFQMSVLQAGELLP